MRVLKAVGKIFLVFVGTLAVAVLGFTVLHQFFGLRVEAWGAGYKPHFYFYKPEEHFATLEKSRAEQKAAAPALAPVSATAPATADPAPDPPPAASASAAAKPASSTSTTTSGLRPYWTGFRGPHRDGVYDETPILTAWSVDGPQRLWKQPIGGGYASFSVAQGKAFTIEQRRENEVVAAYDVDTGRELWTTAWPALFSETIGGDGPRATPTWDDGRIYALGGTGEFRCLDAATGKVLWKRNILTDNGAINLLWGMAASPLVVDGKVIVQPGGRGGKSVVAYDKLTGEPVWKSLDDKASYTSPVIANMGGERQIIVVSGTRVVGLRLKDGGLLWQYPWYTSPEVNSAEPVFLDDHRFFVSSGFDHGGVLLDVSREGDAFNVKPVWTTKRMKTRFNTAVYYQGDLYGLDEGILACIDAANGELKWKGGRYGYGQVLLASGHLIVMTEDGDLVLVKASPEKLQEVSRVPALEGKTWNYPAIDNGRLLVRNTTEMAAFQIQ
ncbi:MAG TPA: PQQ-binding-like beta-propeller repeat protein [Bryobacteraceae bacterium]|nr:PQQ-binding-like beta-propeller repeat protein [Bryobacteraceae bacterium]